MMSSIAAKIGAMALAPFMALGANAQVTNETAVQAQQKHIPDAVCTEISHNLYFGLWDRQVAGEVTELQAYLRADGYLKQKPTGFYGMATYRAVRNFQSDQGLRATGVVNAETRAEIKEESCGTSENEDLRINGIAAPSSLDIGEEGTWTVDVTSSGEGNLSYAVVWGDEGTMRRAALTAEEVQSSATFTHTYSAAGTYTPTFTVTDASGNTVSEAAASVTVGESETEVHLSSLSATSGYAGDSVTITGTGFASDSSVYVGGTKATAVSVDSDTSITFTIPSIGTGSYDVYVENANGTSNTLRYEVKEQAAVRISIASIDAPVRLKVGQEGTWTVNTDTNASGNLKYSASWGDEGMMRAMFASDSTVQTSSSFTHSYDKAGTYKPTFTVSDEDGHSSKVSATIVVTN